LAAHSHKQSSAEVHEPQNGDRAVFWDARNPLGYANRTGAYKTGIEWSFIRGHLPRPPASVLDIGGGSGRFALRLMNEGFALTVADKDAPSLRLLQERAGAHAPALICSDFRDATIPGVFEAAIAVECLENMPFADVLGRVRGLLKPQGVFVFTVLNRSSWRFGLRRLAGREEKGEFVERLSDYRSAWEQAGFEEVGTRGFMWTLLTVTSNSRLVPLFVGTERVLRLHSLVGQSPWVLIALRRTA
jgi:SAM-dependent methyltransferase